MNARTEATHAEINETTIRFSFDGLIQHRGGGYTLVWNHFC
jgi:hypothetical protein